MSVKVLKQYKATYEDNGSSLCNALDMEEAVRVLSDESEPVIVQKVADGIKVSVPDPSLGFTTSVSEGATGCQAYPRSGSGIKLGDTLFLSAVAAEGFTFEGWYQGETLLSEEAETSVIVASTSQIPAVIEYVAKFTAQ